MTTYITVKQETKEKALFNDAKNTCKAEDPWCQTDTSTIIWNKDIIHDCPYYRIKEIKANVTDHLVISDYILFQMTTKSNECGIEIIQTTEGPLR